MKNNIIAWDNNKALENANRARESTQAFAQVDKITNATEASIVLKTLDTLADNAEFIRAKVLQRMQEIKDFGKYKNVKEWAVSQGIGRSTVYKYIDAALLINANATHSIAPARENCKDYTYSRLKVFTEKVKPVAKEEASRLAKMSAKEKKAFWGDGYDDMKNEGVDNLTKVILMSKFTRADADGKISPDMPVKDYETAIDILIGKAVIDDTPTESIAESTADTPAESNTENTAEKKKAIKLTKEEWDAIVKLCDRIKAGEAVTELPADVVKVLTAHA